MNTQVFSILSYAFYPAVAVLLGGVVALVRTPGESIRSAIQHFTAGVIFAALATELLPEVMHKRMPLVTIAGFSLGVIVMLGMKHFTEKLGQKGISQTKRPTSLILTLGVDVALDGMLIGLGFAAGQKQGLLLTIALSLEVLFLGMSASAALSKAEISRKMILLIVALFAGLLLSGSLIGAVLLSVASGAMLDAVLAFGVAALLYLVTEELLVEAHETPETMFQTGMFFVGFIVLLVIEMLL